MSRPPIEIIELPEDVDYVVTPERVTFNRLRSLSEKAAMLPEVTSLWKKAVEQGTGWYSENGDHIYKIQEERSW